MEIKTLPISRSALPAAGLSRFWIVALAAVRLSACGMSPSHESARNSGGAGQPGGGDAHGTPPATPPASTNKGAFSLTLPDLQNAPGAKRVSISLYAATAIPDTAVVVQPVAPVAAAASTSSNSSVPSIVCPPCIPCALSGQPVTATGAANKSKASATATIPVDFIPCPPPPPPGPAPLIHQDFDFKPGSAMVINNIPAGLYMVDLLIMDASGGVLERNAMGDSSLSILAGQTINATITVYPTFNGGAGSGGAAIKVVEAPMAQVVPIAARGPCGPTDNCTTSATTK